MKKIILLLILVIGIYTLFLFKQNKNTWICVDGEWQTRGNTSSTQPTEPCSVKEVIEGEIISKADEIRKNTRALNIVDYSGKNLTKFPIEILDMIDTKVLILTNNKITSLPSEIGLLVNLEELYIDHNQLTGALPAEIRKMSKLQKLDASDNKLTGIPAEIGQLSHLRRLDLSNNSINSMPNEIFNLKDNLEVLNLFGNKYSDDQIIDIQGKLPKTKINF